MARDVVVARDGKTSTFGMKKVDRSKLYGRRRRLALGPDDKPCRRAGLTEDGSLLILPGMTSQGYFTEDGTWVPNSELVGLDDEGNTIDEIPSTLGVEQALEGPVDPASVLDLRVHSVYALERKEVEDSLFDDLNAGKIFRFTFNYRPGYQADAAFLVANASGDVFALIGKDVTPMWQDVKAILPVIEDDGDEDDDLDFEMF